MQDAQAQLLAAFQKHDWLWQLLLRKHLADLLQHPAAARLFVDVLGRLPGGTQARAYCLWRQQLQQAPLQLAVPLAAQQALLEQLRLCFQTRAANLPLLGGELVAQQQQSGGIAAAADGAVPVEEPPHSLAASAEVRVVLREQLPHLLQLLLMMTCAAGGEASVSGSLQKGGSSDKASGQAPSLSSMQSAAEGARLPPRSRDGKEDAAAKAAETGRQGSGSAVGGTAGGSICGAGICGVRDAVLRHAVLLVSRLSDPDALHELLGIQLRHAPGGRSGGGNSSGDEEADGQEAATDGEQQQQYTLSQRDLERARTAVTLIEACLDGMLTLSSLAAAVHQQLHSKGNSSAAAGTAEEQQAAAAELRHTAGLLLGMHRELSRFHSAQQQQHGGWCTPQSTALLACVPCCTACLYGKAVRPYQMLVPPALL